eukprot:1394364-Amorphochlora_amoeboformis.AAC.1
MIVIQRYVMICSGGDGIHKSLISSAPPQAAGQEVIPLGADVGLCDPLDQGYGEPCPRISD